MIPLCDELKDSKLSEKQVHAITILCTGESKKKTARRVGISEKTIYAWLKDETFKDALEKQQLIVRQQVFNSVLNKLCFMSDQALESLEQLLTSDCDRVKLGSAKTILQLIFQSHSLDVQAELLELKTILEGLTDESEP